MKSKRLLLACAAITCAMAVGCESPPKVSQGNTGGRLDPYQSTGADRASGSALIPALLEFSDKTAQRLAADIAGIREITGSDTKVVLELGGINNQTRTSTGDFELIQRRVRGQLLASRMLREHFLVVDNRVRMNLEQERVQADGEAGATAKYDPKITYVLLGDFFEANRGGRRQYYFEFTLTNLASRAIVFHSDYDLGQVN